MINREKLFIHAFVFSVFIICLVGTICNSQELNNLTYALIIPIFLITILEFIIEIKEKAKEVAFEKSKKFKMISEIECELAEEKINSLKRIGEFEENNLPKDVQDNYEMSIRDTKKATKYTKLLG